MAFNWEIFRDEICDLYLVQQKTVKQIVNLMQEKHGLTACERTYWKKIKHWGAHKYAAARQAQHTPRQSIDSGYHSRSLRSSSSIASQNSHLVKDTPSVWDSLVSSYQQPQQYGFPPWAEHFSASQPRCESRIGNSWSSVSSEADDFQIDTALISQQVLDSHNFAEIPVSNGARAVHQSENLSSNAPSRSSGGCGDRNRLSSCVLDFCSPHALPSTCFAAHSDMELIGPSNGAISCQYCNATELHRVASMSQRMELCDFKNALLEYNLFIGQRDIGGNTCLHFAAGSGASLAQLEALVYAGLPMELTNNARQTFLHVLNTKLYSRGTLPQIIQWALRTEGAMTARDSKGRTVWHSIFQRGISPDVFESILPNLWHNEDMMILDGEMHTPLDCLRLYWTSTREKAAIDFLNSLLSSGYLLLYFAVNRTPPLIDETYKAEMHAKLLATPTLSADVSRLTLGTSMKRRDRNNPARHGVQGVLSTYSNGGLLECNTSEPLIPFLYQSVCASPLPTNLPDKARRVLFGP